MAKTAKLSKQMSLSVKQAVIVALAFGLMGGYVVATSFAAKPIRTNATISVNPSAPKVGDQLVFSGCGYAPSTGLSVVVQTPAATSFFGGPADASGCYDSSNYETFSAGVPGTYTVKTYQGDGKGRDKPAATQTFTVTE